MSSESDHEEEDFCENSIFVELLKEAKILFDKDCTPIAKNKKRLALESITIAYNLKTKQNLNTKQVLKKFNNMKARIKAATDKNRTGNKRIVLKSWEKLFYELWTGEKNNPVLSRIPGAITAGDSRQMSEDIIDDSTVLEADYGESIKICDDFEGIDRDDLQRLVLVAQIKVAQSQEKAAKAHEKAAVAQEKAAVAQEKAALAQEKAALAQEALAIRQKNVLEGHKDKEGEASTVRERVAGDNTEYEYSYVHL